MWKAEMIGCGKRRGVTWKKGESLGKEKNMIGGRICRHREKLKLEKVELRTRNISHENILAAKKENGNDIIFQLPLWKLFY